MNFPAWQLALKMLASIFGNYTDYSDGTYTYTYLGRYTNGTKWDCINKFFLRQRLVPSSVNKNFHVI